MNIIALLPKLARRYTKCEIFVKKLDEFSYIFHIPDEATRKWILSRGLWHVDDCILFVALWTPSNSLTLPQITSIPVWVTLKNIPSNLYSIFGIEWIASGLGEPMLSHKPWCGLLGHKSKRCLSISGHKSTTSVSGKKVSSVAHVFASSSDGSALNMNIQKDTEGSAAENTAAKMGATLPSDTHAQSSPQQKSTTPNPTMPTTSQDTQRDGNQQRPVLPAHTLTSQSPIVFGSCIEELNVSRVTQPPLLVEELLSLTTISVLENMYKSPTIVCINEKTDSPPLDSAPPLQNMDSTPKETSSMALKDCSSSDPLHLVSNQFASLVSLEGEEDGQLDMEDCTDSIDYMTPSGKRMLRERPVKPTTKAKELQMQSSSHGRGNRGRENRGKH
ncbi:LOW QUALITY PROTEIN: hypothetical protein N665_0203s0024 [Sinapis alba]|nr:LOW QUALITY PROTEIN: hypothetical protein N665_0203s0024 [Sinapis alba]